MRRVAAALVLFASFLPPAACATTAFSLSDRITIDGTLDEYAGDEWVLDATSSLPETDRDSRWGSDNDISRVAVTWDRGFLYVAVEFRTFDTFAAVLFSNRAGGLFSLEDAGALRRAIDVPGIPINLIALAAPGRSPEVARVDAANPFSLVDRATLPAAVKGGLDGRAGFEMAVPWTFLTLANPVRLVGAITGEVGEGAGDAAPDPTAALDSDRFARATLDRGLVFDADTNDDGLSDIGVAPRTAATLEPGSDPARSRTDADLAVDVDPRAFAPDQGEAAAFSFRVESLDAVYVSCAVFSIDGSRVKTLFEDVLRTRLGDALTPDARDRWDGTNAAGEIVRGGAYAVVAEWGPARGERAGRATAAVVVVR